MNGRNERMKKTNREEKRRREREGSDGVEN